MKPYESKLSTALSECKAVARCATRKIYTAINIKNSRMLANDLSILYSVWFSAKCFLCLSPYCGLSAACCTNKRYDVWVSRACSRKTIRHTFYCNPKGFVHNRVFCQFLSKPRFNYSTSPQYTQPLRAHSLAASLQPRQSVPGTAARRTRRIPRSWQRSCPYRLGRQWS